MLALLTEWFTGQSGPGPGWTVLAVLALPSLVSLVAARLVPRRETPAPEPLATPAETRDPDTAREMDLAAPSAAASPSPEVASPPPVPAEPSRPPAPPHSAEPAIEEEEATAPVDAAPDDFALAPPPTAPAPTLASRLARTSEALVGRLAGLIGGRNVDADVLDDLEAMLFGADLGVSTADALLEAVRDRAGGKDAGEVRAVLRDEIAGRVARVAPELRGLAATGSPHVILVLGVNGSGKTTTIGKLAARYAREGKRVVLGAGDTFRAAASDQLEVWADRVGCQLVKGQDGGDPAAVAFDTVKAATARGADVAIVDTAGRLQTKEPLIEELRKIERVIGRGCDGAPHETLLVLDANTGQNAISQARVFTDAVQVTGMVLTKLDGTAKGGVLVGLADEFGIPVRFVGVGEGIDDLRDFDAQEFVDALFAP